MDRNVLTDAQWVQMEPHCLGKPTDPGHSERNNRLFMEAVLWIARTGSPGTVRNFVCGRAVEHYAAMALMKRSPKMTANWALAMDHSRGGVFHSFSDRFKIR